MEDGSKKTLFIHTKAIFSAASGGKPRLRTGRRARSSRPENAISSAAETRVQRQQNVVPKNPRPSSR